MHSMFRKRTSSAINRNGLRLSGASDLHVKLAKASTDADELPVCDYGIVATKAIHTASAITAAARCFDGNSAVCSVQNGVGNEEIIAEHVNYVIRGTTFPAGHVVEPGHVGFDIQGRHLDGTVRTDATRRCERVEELAGFLTRGGMNTIALSDARGAQWTKLIFNAATNPVGALTRLHHGAASRFPPTSELFEALIAEGEAVAKAMGIELHGDPARLGREGSKRSRQTQCQHVAGCAGVTHDRGGLHEWRHREVGRKVRSSDAVEPCDVGADQGPGTWVDGAELAISRELLAFSKPPRSSFYC